PLESSTRGPPAGADRQRAPDVPPHAEDAQVVLDRAGVTAAGLTPYEARRRLDEHGKNTLPEAPQKSALRRLIEPLASPLVPMLLAAAGIAIVVGATSSHDVPLLSRYGDAIAILLIVILNAVLGYYQERRAEAALEALQKLSAPHARVRRDGKVAV